MNAVGRNQFCRTETARMIPLTINVTFTFIECVPWILCSVKRPFKYCMATLCFEPCPMFCHVIANYYRHSFFFLHKQLVSCRVSSSTQLWQPSKWSCSKTQSHFLIFLLQLGWDYVLPQLIFDSHKLTLHHNVLPSYHFIDKQPLLTSY